MKWNEIIVNTNTEGTELVADAFFSIGCLGGVKIIDTQDVLDVVHSAQMWDYIDEELLKQSKIAKVSGFVSQDECQNKLKELKNYLSELNVMVGEINIQEIDDEDWYDSWKRYYSPINAGRYIIVPKWINYEKADDKIKILMDPGMAFGTGEHESTKMCLELMSNIQFDGKNVIDVGTGSGILGIGAILSNAKTCYMCDIDSVAVKAAQENSKLNGVENKVEIAMADLLSENRMRADIVLANLTADILIRLSEGLTKFINIGGTLICSGIIHVRLDAVISAFSEAKFVLSEHITMGEWDALKFIYNG